MYFEVGSRDDLALKARELRPHIEALEKEMRRQGRLRVGAIAALAVVVVVLVVGTLVVQQSGTARLRKQQDLVAQSLPKQVADAVMTALTQRRLAARTVAGAETALDFPAAFRQVATQFHISPEEAERVARSWAAENSTSTDLSERRRRYTAAWSSRRIGPRCRTI